MAITDKPLLFSKKDYLADSPIFTNKVDCPNLYSPSCALADLHLHDFIELSVVVSGNGLHRIWNKTYECKRGDVFVLNTGVPHCYFGVSEKDYPTVLNVLFDETHLHCSGGSDSDFCYGIFNGNSMVAHQRLSSEELKELTGLCSSIRKEIEGKEAFWQDSASAYLKNLLVYFSRLINGERQGSSGEKESTLVSTALKTTLESYQKPDFTLDSLAKSLFVSKAHLSKLIFKTCGEHFSDYVRNLRIKRSATLLKNTNLANLEIVEQCGFKDLPTFYKNFKAVYGLTPKQYRLKEKENEK